MPFLYYVAEAVLLAHVNLVDKYQHGDGHLPYFLEEVHVLLWILYYVCDIEQDVGIGKGRLRECQHGLLELVVGLQDSGCVGEYYLHVVGVDDAHYPVACRLCLEGGYADFLSDELVHECGLSHIGVAHDVYESCLVHNM